MQILFLIDSKCNLLLNCQMYCLSFIIIQGKQIIMFVLFPSFRRTCIIVNFRITYLLGRKEKRKNVTQFRDDGHIEQRSVEVTVNWSLIEETRIFNAAAFRAGGTQRPRPGARGDGARFCVTRACGHAAL